MTIGIRTVTQDHWFVSTSSPVYSEDYKQVIAGARLTVFRHIGRFQFVYGDANGKLFPDSQTAFDYALEHGYTQEYRKGWCPRCRKQHWFCGARTSACAAHTHPYPGCVEAQEQFDADIKSRELRDRRRYPRVFKQVC